MSAWIQRLRLARRVRPVALRWSASAIAICAACSAGAPDEAGSEQPDLEHELAEVVYQGDVTDEALVRLLDREPQPESQRQVSVCAPEAGASLTREAPTEFSFSTSGCALAPDAARERSGAAAPHPNRHASKASIEGVGAQALAVLSGALPIGVAHAHGAPFNGTAYYLRVLDASGEVKLQAFTDGTTYTPNQAQWTRMIESTEPLRLEIVWAEFDNNEVVGNGPFQAPPVSLLMRE